MMSDFLNYKFTNSLIDTTKCKIQLAFKFTHRFFLYQMM